MRCLILMMLLVLSLYAGDEVSTFDRAVTLYQSGKVREAFEMFRSLAQGGDADAAHYLARMYETGEGTKQDAAKASYWFKQAAEFYSGDRHLSGKNEFEKRRREIYRDLKLSEHDPDAQRSIRKRSELIFGFSAYKRNYIMPFSVADRVYPSYTPSDQYRKIETEFQFSVSIDAVADLVGLDEIYGFGVTEHVFWQLYTLSAPFREMDFNPEIYILFPMEGRADRIHLKTVKLTYSHQSNGQGNIQELDINASEYPDVNPYWLMNRSRGWNYVSAVLEFQLDRLFADLTLWQRLKYSGGDDNPRLIDYLGHGQLDLHYYHGKQQYDLMSRLNPQTGLGAVEAGWSYPVYGRDSVYWYVKGFSGYGESLIDYDRYVNKFSVGFSFFR